MRGSAESFYYLISDILQCIYNFGKADIMQQPVTILFVISGILQQISDKNLIYAFTSEPLYGLITLQNPSQEFDCL
jgi:hypothetical protein